MSLAVLTVLILAGVWCLIYGEFSPRQVLLGGLFGTLFVLVTGVGRGHTVSLSRLPRRMLYLGLYLLVLLPADLIQSNLVLARRLLRRRPDIRPGIVRVPLEQASWATVALEEHAITVSPGQLVVDYTADERMIYVHMIDVTEIEEKQASLWRRYRDVLQEVFA